VAAFAALARLNIAADDAVCGRQQRLRGHVGKQANSPRSYVRPCVLGKLIGPVCCCALHVLPVFLPCEGGITESVQVLLSRGQAAVEAIAAAPDATSRRDADAFDQLQIIRRMMEKAKQQQWDGVLQVRDFIDTLDVRDLPVDRQQTVMCSARPDAFCLGSFPQYCGVACSNHCVATVFHAP